MTDPEDLDRWRALRKTVVRIGPHPFLRAKVGDMRRFEADTGLRLPRGYRGFIRTFGAGGLGGSGGYCRVWTLSGVAWAMKVYDFQDILGRKSEQLARLVYFADSFLGHAFFWDPGEVTDPNGPEYAIYCLSHGDLDVDCIAIDFYSFITSVCLDAEGYCRALKYSEVTIGPDRVFEPYPVPAPQKRKTQTR